ncbi:MAG TPA: ABC transporter permease [Vicinamibacteria bacterium]|nr:ABC transporter permease [Vicinamibacteria bacterium]
MADRIARWVVSAASWLVPRREREAWRLEWESEIWHHRREHEAYRRIDWRFHMNLIARSFGAVADALDVRGSGSLGEGLGADFRYGLRMLRKSPSFTLVAVMLLALSIGATTAIFSLVNAVLLKPLPFRNPQSLVLVWENAYKRDRERNVVSPHNFLRWRERARSFESLAAFTPWAANVMAEGEAERVSIGYISPDFFSTLGVSAAVGRVFAPEDGVPGNDKVVLLGDGFWKRRFGGDRGVVGKTLRLNGREVSVVGVLPPGIEFPSSAQHTGSGIQLWSPFAFTDEHREVGGRYLRVLGRLAPGVGVEQAADEMKRIAADLEEEKPDFDAGWSADVYPLQPELVRNVRSALLVLFAAVAAVLLIACANVGNLLLIRSLTRERELSVRAALGARRWRILRQLFIESLLLAVLGGVGGLALGRVLLTSLVSFLPAEVPTLVSVELDGWVLGFTLGISFLTSFFFGLLPAVQTSRRDLVEPLREGSRVGSSASRQQLKNALVVLEMAVAVVLLVATGLFVRSFLRLSGTDPGFDPKNVTAVQIDLAGPRYEENEAQLAYFLQALERIESLPAVETTGAISWLPLGSGGSATSFRVADKPDPPPEEPRVADVRVVAGDLFRTLRIPLLEGRTFDGRDRAAAPAVVIVNRTLADTVWPGENPLGKTVLMEWWHEIEAEVVGVVGDVRLTELSTTARPTLYWPQSQFPNNFMTLVVRRREGMVLSSAELRAELSPLDAEVPLTSIGSMEEVVARSIGQPRVTLTLMSVFAVAAILLAAIGLYGVIAFGVSQRVHEIGLRMALGASRGDVARLVVGQGLKLALFGSGIGVAGALVASRYLEGLLYQVEPRDPLTILLIAALLLAVSLAASYLPARRATRVDPFLALRVE